MLDFIKQYWLQALFTAVVSALTFAVKNLYKKIKTDREEEKKKREAESKEQEIIKQGVLAILHDRLYQGCQFFLKRGSISVPDLDNLEYLYNSYHALGGNGTGTELYTRCKALPIIPNSDTQGGV